MNKGEVIIYQTPDGNTQLDVQLEDETVWLSLNQISTLFERDKSVISRHIRNIYREQELEEKATVAKNATVQNENGREVLRQIEYYNLDVIISVGYRVKSQRGTQFRIWANNILKEYLIKGYAINQNAKNEQLENLKKTVKLLSNVIASKALSADEATGLLRVITDYTYALDTLDRYDYQKLEIEKTTVDEAFKTNYDNAMEAIYVLRDKFGSGGLFGNEKDQSFKSSISTIYQTFGGEELYPSIEEKAAMLLYLVTKNHSFSDGNKRIAAFLFLWFLEKNGILYKSDSTRLIENNTLVALTLMIAESRTEEKDIMVKVIVNLINQNN
ncbi:virulence protein RhuM/Fic/DOC family protein [Dysgonomonas mossii]|uniref:Fic/DOC family protein n=1 Tax=Dysgonomonas mossii TaxID=163665 RepID=A0A4Y9IJH2_9BACT|nr:RhuM family protein [Dysgonomonas mossii]MBF0762150.1 virulence protein RhuM/Fic/DOC family protein [Dysgonomonas mossii]TFU87206.1 Fic/DOC family protein [Dysgonomonas mossii]